MKKLLLKTIFAFFFIQYFLVPPIVFAEVLNLDANRLVAKAEISITPAQASFVEGSTFEVPILLNTKGRSMNSIELNISYDPKKLMIVNPSVGKSIISMWADIPRYDNTRGTASFVGSIPGGIVSDSSLIITITFQAKAVGTAEVRVLDTSAVLVNDGVGTQAILSTNRAVYNILPKPPGSINVYSDTHPFQDNWYNNNSPTLAWSRDQGVIGYSFVLDDKPNTIPENQNLTNETSKSYQDLADGLWYFHIKALKGGGAWGSTTHYILRIDTTPPAKFKPKVNYLLDDHNKRALVSFFTTDALSGIGHYEVGVIDKSLGQNSSPIFVRAESPYQVPQSSMNQSAVIIRAYDLAGNSIDIQSSVNMPGKFANWLRANITLMLVGILLFILMVVFAHYGWKHKLLKRLKLVVELLNVEKQQNLSEVVNEVKDVIDDKPTPTKIEPPKEIAKIEPPKEIPKVEPAKAEAPKIDPKPEIKIDPKPEPKPEPKIEPKPEIKPEVKIEPVKPSTPEPVVVATPKIVEQPKEIEKIKKIEIPKKEPLPYIKPYPKVNFSPLPKLDIKPDSKPEEPKFDLRNMIQKAISLKTQPEKETPVYQGDNLIKDKLSKTVVSFQSISDDHIELDPKDPNK